MRAAIRADASVALGTGHLRRCLSLAKALRACGAEILFLSSRPDDTAEALLDGQPFEVRWLEPALPGTLDARQSIDALDGWPPDFVVVDHYGLDRQWHDIIRTALRCRIAVIDDLADRPLAPDVLIDHNLHPDAQSLYAQRLLRGAKTLFGPRFALLDPAYASAPRYAFREEVRSIGVFMGGTDPTGACMSALLACRDILRLKQPMEVVCSSLAPGYGALATECARWPATRLIERLPDLASFFARHDVQIGAGGGAVWERCYAGVPTLACMVADNQRTTLPALDAAGAVVWVRDGGEGLASAFAAELAALIPDVRRRLQLSQAAASLVDGHGSHRVAAVLACAAGAKLSVRNADLDDEALLLEWANDPLVRAQAFNTASIAPDEHAAWFRARLDDSAHSRMVVIQAPNGIPVGQVRLDRSTPGSWEISYSMDAAFRGLGLGAPMLEAAQRTGIVGATDKLRARVKLGNEASARVFRRLGFREEQTTDDRGAHWLFTLEPRQA